MNGMLKVRRLLVTFALLSAGSVKLDNATTTVEGIPYSDLCGIQAVRVRVVDSAHLLKSSTPSDGELTAEVAGYLSEHKVTIAQPADSDAPLLWIQIGDPPVGTERYVVVLARFQEKCSVQRLPGRLIPYCATWPIEPSLSFVRRGEEAQVHDLLKSIAKNFIFAYERAKMLCSTR